ncbi:hypothetical protein [Deinococcus multiflagellatus]|uniref:Uncharacterized protein n=1 Tax=Deinococcus multiflagellatus TaxID=1656887 RepID=A0ABW1ZJC2_9DEIO|nr:hypothetical protein [Deinococcus multiflagellatus]MBZ9712419.1 hypothetical protein [Deinococcus multiflagellatus]
MYWRATPGWPPRVAECPVQLEVELLGDRPLSAPHLTALEVRVARSFFAPAILNPARRHHVDPDRWRPLIMSFCEFYSLGEQVYPSRLAAVF